MLLILSLLALPGTTSAESVNTGPENIRCLACHGDKNNSAMMNNRHLVIDSSQYAATTHSYIGCTSCHTAISATHPNGSLKPAAPSKATCKECHGPVHAEYATSMHGSKATCTDCHNPHEVKAPSAMAGKDINAKCAKCHDTRKIITSHAKWLPQADLHIESLPCITCHTASKNYVITLFVQNRKQGASRGEFKLASRDELSRLLPAESELGSLIDKNNDGTISLNDLRSFNKAIKNHEMRLWGMMTPETVSHSYEILDNRWDCSFCHAAGPKAMQTSYVAFPDKSGGYTRIVVEKGAILDILNGTPDFYMLGATRSTVLNIVGALIVAGGLMMPVCHGTLRFLTRKNRKKHTS
ncbi:MAG: cytochrome C [Verrucomicrobia bacterium]|nr:cytochrome C [Deltaproteobacteria bacterium]